jgi:hypothetical protein
MNRIYRICVWLTLSLLLAGTNLTAQKDVSQEYKDRYNKEGFEKADTNNDGFVSLEEAVEATTDAEQGMIGKKRFESADVNNDGRLSPEEAREQRYFEISLEEDLGERVKDKKGSPDVKNLQKKKSIRDRKEKELPKTN